MNQEKIDFYIPLKVFRFKSSANSYLDGYHYFGVMNLKAAKIMAEEYQKQNNINSKPAYKIKFDMSNVEMIVIENGYISDFRHYDYSKTSRK